MTDRLLRAIECPWVDVIAHPTGRMILRREPCRANMDRVFDARHARTAWRSRSTASRIVSTSTTCSRGGRAIAASG